MTSFEANGHVQSKEEEVQDHSRERRAGVAVSLYAEEAFDPHTGRILSGMLVGVEAGRSRAVPSVEIKGSDQNTSLTVARGGLYAIICLRDWRGPAHVYPMPGEGGQVLGYREIDPTTIEMVREQSPNGRVSEPYLT